MGKIILLLACVAGGAYWYVGSRQITEADVHKYYAQENTWIEERNSKELCASLDDKYQAKMINISVQGRQVIDSDKSSACHDYELLFESFKALGAVAGGEFLVQVNQDLDNIAISTDKKNATVAVKTVFKAGTSKLLMIKISGKGTETFAKRNGRLYRTGADGTAVIE